jgi:hypothetical protein
MEAKGFFTSLFDYSFRAFVTPKIIKILYVLATAVISLWTIVLMLAGFRAPGGLGVIVLLIVAPLFFIISMIWARVWLELIMVFFRINANVQDIHDGHRGKVGQPAPTPETPSGAVPGGAPAGLPPETGQEPAAVDFLAEDDTEAAPSAPGAPAPGQAAVRYCENCGAERSPTARFCTSCGHE